MILAVLVAALGYLDLTEIAVKAYDDAHMEAYVREAETSGVQEHGFPRLAANLGRLVAAGRMTEKKPMLERMLTVACACARKGKMPPKSGGNEFSVRELVSAVVALEKAETFPPEKVAEKTVAILRRRRPAFAYSLNRNPWLRLLHLLPKRMQLRVIRKVLKTN